MPPLTKLLSALLITSSCYTLSSELPAWSYEGTASPEHWGELSSKFKKCQDGKNQSPVNISSTHKIHSKPLVFKFNEVPLTEINNGHTVQVNDQGGDLLTLDNETFSLLQFHFHAPSENVIDGKSFPLEAHFVHKNAKGELAVVAIMYQFGKENVELEKLWRQMPGKVGGEVKIQEKIRLEALFPTDLSYYRFSGSLTTPPCTEGVRWIVLKNTMTLSKAQRDVFLKALHHHNNRPIQPLNGRIIDES